jgi:predicted Zn-ribbon and HTH transcriptional regulator
MNEDEQCSGCGQYECECHRRVEGYECGKCGYTPTRRELNNGSCPRCPREET